MLFRIHSPACLLCFIACIVMTTGATPTTAAEPIELPTSADLHSVRWWLDQAAQYAAQVEDADSRSDTYWKLTYECAYAGEFDLAEDVATKVTKPLTAIYALTFVAQRLAENGRPPADAARLMAKSRGVAEKSARQISNFGTSHLFRAYVALKLEAEARAYIDAIADPVQRDLAGRDLLAAQAKFNRFDAAADSLSPAEWSQVAYAYAGEGRVTETLAAVKRLASDDDRDRALASLARFLVEHHRWQEAEPIAEQIRAAALQAQVKGQILAEWARAHTADEIAARLAQATTRDEKAALYDGLIEKLAAENRVDEAERAIEAHVALIKSQPRPAAASAFGSFDDAAAIAAAKSHYADVAKALAKRGDPNAARERIQRAADAVLALADTAGLGKSMLVIKIVDTQIEIGDLQGARSNLEKVGGFFSAMPAARLAAAYAEVGDTNAAIEVSKFIRADYKGRGNLYGSVAAALIRAGDDAGSARLLGELGTSADDAEAYLEAAAAMLNAEGAAQVESWIRRLPAPIYQAYASLGTAEALRKAAGR